MFSSFKTAWKSLWSAFGWILYITHNLWEEVNLDLYSVKVWYLGSPVPTTFSWEISSSSEGRKFWVPPDSFSSGGFDPSDCWSKRMVHLLLLTCLFLAGFLARFWIKCLQLSLKIQSNITGKLQLFWYGGVRTTFQGVCWTSGPPSTFHIKYGATMFLESELHCCWEAVFPGRGERAV